MSYVPLQIFSNHGKQRLLSLFLVPGKTKVKLGKLECLLLTTLRSSDIEMLATHVANVSQTWWKILKVCVDCK